MFEQVSYLVGLFYTSLEELNLLSENLELFKQSDGQIGKRARQLNLSKGELLLAARLKLYEVGKM